MLFPIFSGNFERATISLENTSECKFTHGKLELQT